MYQPTKCLCSRYLSETSKPRRHHLTNHNTRLLSTRQSQPMFTVSQLSRTPNHTLTNNEMGVTRKRDVVLTRLTATILLCLVVARRSIAHDRVRAALFYSPVDFTDASYWCVQIFWCVPNDDDDDDDDDDWCIELSTDERNKTPWWIIPRDICFNVSGVFFC